MPISGFKLSPAQPTTNCKILITKDRPDQQSIPISILGWNRVFPNKVSMPILTLDPGSYQCTALDSFCIIQTTIQYKIGEQVFKKVLATSPIRPYRELKERALYQMQPCFCKISIDQWCVKAKVLVQNRKIKLFNEVSRFQSTFTERTIQIEPYNQLTKFNFAPFMNEFVKFFAETLKWVPKFRSTSCLIIFNSKIEEDLFLFSIADNFKQSQKQPQSNINLIKIISNTPTPTPTPTPTLTTTTTPVTRCPIEKEKEMKNDGSSSSLTQVNNTSKNNKNTIIKQKVRITQKINLKKSQSKASSSKFLSKIDSQVQDTPNSRGVESLSIIKISDSSMDLRGSFEQFERSYKTKETTDNNTQRLSNHSFKQKQAKKKPLSPQSENSALKAENLKLKQQVESMRISVKQLGNMKKKYESVVNQLKRLQSERIAIVRDKIQFQSLYYQVVQEKQKIKKDLLALRSSLKFYS